MYLLNKGRKVQLGQTYYLIGLYSYIRWENDPAAAGGERDIGKNHFREVKNGKQ